MLPGERPDGFWMKVASGPSWGKRAQQHLARLQWGEGAGLGGWQEHIKSCHSLPCV